MRGKLKYFLKGKAKEILGEEKEKKCVRNNKKKRKKERKRCRDE